MIRTPFPLPAGLVRKTVTAVAALLLLVSGPSASILDAVRATGCAHGDHAGAGHETGSDASGHHADADVHAMPEVLGESITVQSDCDHCPQEGCAVSLTCGAVGFALRAPLRVADLALPISDKSPSADFGVPSDVPTTHQTPPPKIRV